MMRGLLAFTLVVAATGGCDPTVLPPEDGTSSEGSGSSGPTTLPDPTDERPTTTLDPSGATTGGSDASSGEGTCGSLCDPTDTPDPLECSLWLQDCPDGQKCSAWASDGGGALDALRCVPVDPDPDDVGDPCTVEGSGGSGIDSCVVGAMCWDFDPRTNVGICAPHCIGSPTDPGCADPNRACIISGDGFLSVCLSRCDPLDPDACPDDEGCYPADHDTFMCAADASGEGGGPFEPCAFTSACDPGLLCADATDNPLCETDAAYCCTPYCALSAPNCPEPLTCIPAYDEGTAPPRYEDLGLCVGD